MFYVSARLHLCISMFVGLLYKSIRSIYATSKSVFRKRLQTVEEHSLSLVIGQECVPLLRGAHYGPSLKSLLKAVFILAVLFFLQLNTFHIHFCKNINKVTWMCFIIMLMNKHSFVGILDRMGNSVWYFFDLPQEGAKSATSLGSVFHYKMH